MVHGVLPIGGRGAGSGRLGRAARAEWGPLYSAIRGAVEVRRLAAIPLALGATALVLAFQVIQHTPVGSVLVERLGAVRAGEPLWLELLRTPVSLFVPAPDLPVWGAAAQVFVVFGIAEITLGRRRTVLIGYAGTLAGTLYARHGVQVGPGHLFGLPQTDAFVRDCGPSAAVVALAVAIAWQYRAWLTGGLIAVFMVAEELLVPNLAGAEHLVAVATAAALAAAGGSRAAEPPATPAAAAAAAVEMAPAAEPVRVAA